MKTDYYNNNSMYCVEINNAIIPSVYYGDSGCCRSPSYGGVFDKNNNFIPESISIRYYRNQTLEVITEGKDNLNKCTSTILNGTYIFGGYIFVQYGHFIMETIARLWASYDLPNIPIIFVSLLPRIPNLQLCPKSNEILDILNITKNRIVLPYYNDTNNIFRVEKLILPTPGSILDRVAHREYLEIIGRYSTSTPKDIDKLWLSRRDYNNQKIINIDEIETMLKNNGWEICSLEKLPTVKAQLDILSRSKNISGFEGSSYHNLVLINNDTIADTNIKMLSRGRNVPPIFDITHSNKNLNATTHIINIKDGVVLDPKEIYDILL